MRVETLSFEQPQQNLEYDDDLLRRADAGEEGEVLRFWESPVYFVVLGRTSCVEDDVLEAVVKRDGIEISRRSSGGGTVLQGPGCLNFSLVLHKKRDPLLASINGSYGYILNNVLGVLEGQGVKAVFKPVCDLALACNEKKFSGNAQRRGREHILHHGTILYDFDLALIERYLKMPPKMPDYRQRRGHADFITNIPLDREAFYQGVRQAFVKG